MMDPSSDQFSVIIANYLSAVDSGTPPNRAQLLLEHPQFAVELQEFFTDYDRMGQIGQGANGGSDSRDPSPTLNLGHATPRVVELELPRGFGDYEILAEIGRGGMGTIYKARQTRLNRMVALKMIQNGQFASREDLQRFAAEAEAAAQLDHPNIVPIHEVGECEGQHYFTMKLIEGCSLADVVSDKQWGARLQSKDGHEMLRMAASLMAKVARAVHYAHQHGILHRDLKPGNILLGGMRDEGGGVRKESSDSSSFIPHPSSLIPYVTDFGLAKRMESDSNLTQTGAIVGTPNYMSPEQAAGRKDLTTASDTCSLGAILYLLITGQRPFAAETPILTLALVQNADPVRPRIKNHKVPADLETICLKCLNKSPGERYRSALELAEDLERWLDGEPIRAKRVPLWRRAVMRIKRRPGVAVAALLVMLVSGSLLVWKWRDERALLLSHRRDRLTAYVDQVDRASSYHPNPLGLAYLETCDAEYRHWEWNYLQRLYRENFVTRHGREVQALGFNPQGTRVVVCEMRSVNPFRSTAHVLDANSGAEKSVTIIDHWPQVIGLSDSAGAIVAGDLGGVVRLHEVATGKRLAEAIGGWAFSYAGNNQALFGGIEGDLNLMDLSSGKVHPLIPKAEKLEGAIRTNMGSLSADGRYCAVEMATEKALFLCVVELPGKREIFRVERPAVAYDMILSPDGQHLAAIGEQGLSVWHVPTGKHRFDSAGIDQAAFTSDSTQVVGLNKERVVRFDCTTGKDVSTYRDRQMILRTGRAKADGRWLAQFSCGADRVVWTGDDWRTLHCRRLDAIPAYETLPATTFALAGNDVVVPTAEGVRTWDRRKGTFEDVSPDRCVKTLAVSPDRQVIAGAGGDSVFRVENGVRVALPPPTEEIVSLAYGPQLVGKDAQGGIHLWSGENVKRIWDKGCVGALASSADGSSFASMHTDGEVRVWHGDRVSTTLPSSEDPPVGVAFSADGALLAVGHESGLIVIWDLPSRGARFELRGEEPARALTFSPDGGRLVVSSKAAIHFWELKFGSLVFRMPCDQPVHQLAFTPNGQALIAAMEYRVGIWSTEP